MFPIYDYLPLLIVLDHATFSRFCQANKFLYDIYKGKTSGNHAGIHNNLFYERNRYWYSKEIQYKDCEPNLTWRKFYFRMLIKDDTTLDEHAFNGHFIELKIQVDSSTNKRYIHEILAETINGNLEMIKFLLSFLENDDKQYTYYQMIYNAVKYGHVHILNYMNEKKILSITTQHANFAIQYDRYKVLKWLAEKNIFPTMAGIANLFYQSKLKLFIYLCNFSDLYNDVAYANKACMYGRLKFCIFMYNKYGILPNVIGANNAARCGHIHILKWLYNFEIKADSHGAEKAATHGKYKSILWLEKHRIQPKYVNIDVVAGNGYLDILKHYYVEFGLPSKIGLELVLESNYLHVIKWLWYKNVRPDSDTIDRYKDCENSTMKWIREQIAWEIK